LLVATSLTATQRAEATAITLGGGCGVLTQADADASFRRAVDGDSGGGSPVLCQSSIASSASDQYPGLTSMRADSAAAIDWTADSLGGLAADGLVSYSLLGWYPPTGGPPARGTATSQLNGELRFRVDRPTTVDLTAQLTGSGSLSGFGGRIQLLEGFGRVLFELASGTGTGRVLLQPGLEYLYRVNMGINGGLFIPPPLGTSSLSGEVVWSLNAVVVPLPAALWLLAGGVVLLAGAARKRNELRAVPAI
jgi:hypothetical protein